MPSAESDAPVMHMMGPDGLFGQSPLCGVAYTNGMLRQSERWADVSCVLCLAARVTPLEKKDN